MTKGDAVSIEPHVHRATRDDLLAAMRGEAFAYASYMLFAEAARRNGRPEVARLFEETAGTELMEHFAQQAALAGLVGTDADNLRTAIEAESYEIEAMYPSYAEHARAAGDTAARACPGGRRHGRRGSLRGGAPG